ncbi:lytic transglycosylase domain-containing protein [Novosphingobium jiangmenense]|nr:lytic transglycosylase domain-containing protein [Novosphingobium jiangmenense]
MLRHASTALALAAAAPAFGQVSADPAPPRTIAIASHVAESAQRFGIPEAWIYAVMRIESAGRVGAVSSAGAMGLMQLMPATWARQRARFRLGSDPFDPRDNILAGTGYLRELYDSYGASGFLAAYNAGPGRYEDWRDKGRPLPAETVSYVARIAPRLQGSGMAASVADAMPVQPVGLSWTQSQLFAARGDGASGSLVTAAPLQFSREPARPLGGLFAPVVGTASQ